METPGLDALEACKLKIDNDHLKKQIERMADRITELQDRLINTPLRTAYEGEAAQKIADLAKRLEAANEENGNLWALLQQLTEGKSGQEVLKMIVSPSTSRLGDETI